MVLTVFEDKHTTFLQESLLKDQIRYCRQFLEGIGRIGEDEVKLVFARLYKTEHITAEGYASLCVELLQTILDKTVVVSVCLYTDDVAAAS